MPDSSMTFTTGSGVPFEETVIQIEGFIKPTQAELKLAGEFVRTGIRERTAHGVDAAGAPFAPYNETRPFYWNPATANGQKKLRFGEPAHRFTAKARKAAVTRLIAKLRAGALREGTVLLGSSTPRSGTGQTIKFASYGAFKRAFGRAYVDLFGIGSQDHMLDNIEIRAGDGEVRIGIYEDRAHRLGMGHSSPNRPEGMPLRKFMGLGTEDVSAIRNELATRIRERILSRK